MAIGFLAAVPISIGIAVGVILRHIGMSDVACLVIGTAIAVPGAVIVFILLMRYLRKQDDERNGRAIFFFYKNRRPSSACPRVI